MTLTNAIGSGAAGWLLDRSGLGLAGLLLVMAGFTTVLGGLWWAWMALGEPARSDGARASGAPAHT